LKRFFMSITISSILLFIMLSLTGCLSSLLFSKDEPDSGYVQMNNQEPYSIEAKNAISAAIPEAPVIEKKPEMVTAGDNIAEMIYQRAYYDVISVDGNICTVQVVAPDMQVIYWDAFEQATVGYGGPDAEASAQMETVLMDIVYTQLESGNYPVRQTVIELEFLGGEPRLTYEFADAMYGGMLTVYGEMMAAYEEN